MRHWKKETAKEKQKEKQEEKSRGTLEGENSGGLKFMNFAHRSNTREN